MFATKLVVIHANNHYLFHPWYIHVSPTLISLDGEYYKYHVGEKKEQGLEILGYESAFIANLVAYYLFEKSKNPLNQKTYHGIYHDSGLVVFKGKNKVQPIKYWSAQFQQIVDKVEGNQTPTVHCGDRGKWYEPPPSSKKDKVKIVANDKFAFLYMKMSWSPEGDLQYGLFSKKGQQLKYVGKGITHTPSTLHAIPSGVLNRLAKLISCKPNFNS